MDRRQDKRGKTHTGLPYPWSDPYIVDFNVVPELDDKYSLGTATHRFKAVYVMDMFIYNDLTISSDLVV